MGGKGGFHALRRAQKIRSAALWPGSGARAEPWRLREKIDPEREDLDHLCAVHVERLRGAVQPHHAQDYLQDDIEVERSRIALVQHHCGGEDDQQKSYAQKDDRGVSTGGPEEED